jgi:hypothetical protein
MKNRWLIILFIFFLGTILLSLLITRQSQRDVFIPEKAITLADQTGAKIPVAYLSVARKGPIMVLPLKKSGITIIKAPVISTSEEKINSVSKIAAKAANNISSLDVGSAGSDMEAKDNLQTGITKTGRHPSPAEVLEMNSSGIVLY